MPTLLVPPLARARHEPVPLEEVEAALQSLNIRVRVVEAADHASFDHDVTHETVQLAWAPPMLTSRIEPTARAILTVNRAGRTGYRSALIARKSDALTPTTLSGKRAIWNEPHSTAGYALPLSLLRMLKQDTAKLFSEQKFAGTYRDALLEVANGNSDVTAIYSPRADERTVEKAIAELIGALSEKLCAIAFTDEVPSDALVITSAVDTRTADEWTRAFLALPATHPLMRLLSAERLTRARDGDYRYLRTAPIARAPER